MASSSQEPTASEAIGQQISDSVCDDDRPARELKSTQEALRQRAEQLARSEAELQKQAATLESILRCIGDGVVVADREGTFLAFNPAAERLVGRGAIDAGPRHWTDSYGLFLADGTTPYPSDDLPLARAMRGEDVKEAEVVVKNDSHPEGILLSVTATPLRDDQGRLHGGVAVFRDITEHRKAEDALRESQEQLVAEKQSLKQLLELRERERKLFAHDIHDGFLQEVIGAKMLIDRLAELDATCGDAFQKNFDQASEYLASAIEEGRRLIGDLRPMILDERGIVEAVEYLVNDARFCEGVNFDYTHEVRFTRLPPMFEVSVFRIIQEAMINVRRHSRADRAEVALRQTGDQLSIEVTDHGVGFDPKSVPDARFGLWGMSERARLFDGKAEVVSAPGEGTTVRVQLPLPDDELRVEGRRPE